MKKETEVLVPIGKDEIIKARQTLMRYKSDKANLEKKIVANEDWWKLRHWEQLRSDKSEYKPASAWLWNVIVSKHADAMDAFPEPNLLPRSEDDRGEAKKLSSIIPVILEQNEFEKVYSELQWYKLKQGTGVYGIFWDQTKNQGLGDISIQKVDLLSLFWESGVSNIQKSKNLFHVSLCDREELTEKYGISDEDMAAADIDITKYRYDDNVDTSGKAMVVDWYYRKGGVLHFCKFTGNTLLFASENDPENYPCGWYDHGLYPFVFDTLFSIEGTPCGYGYIDIGKDAQTQIDMLNHSIINNAMLASKPRYFIRGDGAVNEEEFADWTRDFVHTNGNLGKDSILQIDVNPVNPIYVTMLNNKIDELKETSGNRDSTNGGTASGVTAASAIAAMQEAGGKLSRDSNRGSYAAYKQMILMCIELIRQFYDIPRQFRILGDMGRIEFTSYCNKGISPRHQGTDFGVDMGLRTPVFDIEVSPQRSNPYSKMSQNELALQFYNLGFFDPARADMALGCLEMMDFARKEAVMQRISEGAGRISVPFTGKGDKVSLSAPNAAESVIP
ncbi:MAG: hypothetical protein IJB24_07925 [Clostridia bacterium]|nr:hypothetical protein [Clostridia bacterium]